MAHLIYILYLLTAKPPSLPFSLPHSTSPHQPAVVAILNLYRYSYHYFFWLRTLGGERDEGINLQPKLQLSEEDTPVWIAVTTLEAPWQVELSLITHPDKLLLSITLPDQILH